MKDFGQLSYPKEERKESSSKKHGVVVWGIFLLICSGLIILVAFNLLGYHSSQITKASYQILKHNFKTSGLLIRDEKVVFAPQAGEIELKLSEGERLNAGNHIATIHNGQQRDELYNYRPGILSYKVDGLETTLSVKNRGDLTYKKFQKVKGEINRVNDGNQVNIGRPLFKVINNFQVYLAVLLSQEELTNYEVGTKVQIVFSRLGIQPFQGQVDIILPDKPENIMIIKLDKFVPDLISLRRAKVEVIKERHSGIVLPKSALVKNKDGQLGVQVKGYVKDYFTEVEVEARVENKVVVKGVLPGARVLIN
ncbi:hypothetical protein JCM16358_24710 [Halanaerocella petrolearia]